MEMQKEFFMQFLKLAALYLAASFLLKVVKQLWWRPRRIERHFAKQGIRGPPYKFFIGNAKEMEKMMKEAAAKPIPHLSHNIIPRVISFYHYWKKLYGSVFLIWFGPMARLVISDPDLVREVLTNSKSFEKTEPHPLVRQLEGEGLLELKGEKWSLHRKIIAPTFLMENLKMLVPEMCKSVVEMMEKWELKGGKEDELQVEVFESFQTLMEDVISRAAFGCNYEEGKAIYQLQAQQMLLAALTFQKVFIPGYRFLPTQINLKSWRLEREVRTSLSKLINIRKQNQPRKSVSEEKAPKDLLGLMIEASSSSSFSVADIIEECKGFFFAGKETTSSLLTWTTVLLAMHPRWQDVARDEVMTVCGTWQRIPTKDDLGKLKNLNMILNESLRLYSPTVATIRRTRLDTTLGGYMIPRGTELLIPILGLHHDQAVWGPDATEFNPNRFSTNPLRARTCPATFIPFGLGIHNCIGQNLAVLQAKVTIALILQRFQFRLAPSYEHAPTVLLMLYPQHGVQVIFNKLSKPEGSGS